MDSPRLRGIGEHLERAQYLLCLALEENDAKAAHRLMLAAIYSCRALTELMLEAADKQEVEDETLSNSKVGRETLEAQISRALPYYNLVERIRIHDFHRFGLLPPDPSLQELKLGGPIKLMAQNGTAVVVVTDQGPQVSTTGNSHVRFQRPLLVKGHELFDEDSASFVKLEAVLTAFLEKAPVVVSAFADTVS